MKMNPRTKEDSPIYHKMLRDAVTLEDYTKAFTYGAKVDAFGMTGETFLVELDYAGPDLSAGAERENSMKGSVSRSVSSNGATRGFGTPPPEDAGFSARRTPTPRQWSKARGEVVNT